MFCASFQENASVIKTKPWGLTIEPETIKEEITSSIHVSDKVKHWMFLKLFYGCSM